MFGPTPSHQAWVAGLAESRKTFLSLSARATHLPTMSKQRHRPKQAFRCLMAPYREATPKPATALATSLEVSNRESPRPIRPQCTAAQVNKVTPALFAASHARSDGRRHGQPVSLS